jgi:hypothetical protein
LTVEFQPWRIIFLKKVAGALPCIEIMETEDFASIAITPQQATGQPHALERGNP